MRKIFIVFIFFVGACSHKSIPWFSRHRIAVSPTTHYHPMVVVIPSYNNHEWYQYNLDSIIRQKYPALRIIYIDDCSTDKTGMLVEKYIMRNHLSRITLIRNKKRKGALANLWHAISLCKPDEIIVNVDGDDWLAHDHVLAHLNQLYQTNDIWLTYGQFKNWPTKTPGWCKQIPAHIVEKNTFRSYGFWFAQPRTYYAWLAQRINPKDLINPQTNDFYRVAGDVALMFPMVEMAGPHIQFVSNVLYVRNVQTPINDFKCHLEEQLRITEYLQTRPPYPRLQSKPTR